MVWNGDLSEHLLDFGECQPMERVAAIYITDPTLVIHIASRIQVLSDYCQLVFSCVSL